MKPYSKILKPESALPWNGSFQWGINLIVDQEKPTIPLSFFSKVNACTAERKRWLAIKLKVIDEQKTNSEETGFSI
jgi:hypothetical protein